MTDAPTRKFRARIVDIVAIAADMSHIDAATIYGPSRLQHITRVRFCCFVIAREQGYSRSEIGRRMGRDHSSVINGLKVMSKEILLDDDLAYFVASLRERAESLPPFEAERLYRQKHHVLALAA